VRYVVALFLILLMAGAPAGAQEKNSALPGDPVLFKADQLRHERKLGIVIARGNVEITQNDRVLRADTISYNQKTDTLKATGNIVLMEPTGDVMFADYAELTGNFKDGVIQNIRILLSDNARVAAVGGRRIGGEVTEMRKVVYSPCRTCLGPNRPPIWQLKAVKVIHDRPAQTIEYRDAFLEFFGVPVFYTPYLSHPDPTVKRKSGFLTPRYGSDSQLGITLETPYYINIAPDKDLTLRPIITSDEGPVLAGQYRQRFTNGRFEFEGSGTRGSDETGNKEIRGHIFSKTRFDLTDTWRTGADIEFASDDTYLRRYGFRSPDTLTSHLFAEGFRGQNYAAAEAYYWRGLAADDDTGETPIVAPLLSYSALGQPGRGGGRWTLDANFLSLTRTSGTDSRRLSLLGGWELPHIAPTGEVYRLYASLQSDAYFVDDVVADGAAPGTTLDGFTGRIFPRIGLDWRFPFAQSSGGSTRILEPVAGIMISPNGGNPDKVPNEDSQDLEFDDTNLLSRNRFTGIDRVEGGQRLYYGLQMGWFGQAATTSAFVGQSYRVRRDSTFSTDSGLEDHFSDIVGRVAIKPNFPLNIQYRFRLDKGDFSPRRNEVTASLGPKAFKLNVNYSFFGQGTGSGEFTDREEIITGFRSQITNEWAFSASTQRDLELDESLRHNFRLEYVCDCFKMSLDFTRTFTQDRDVRPTETIFLRLSFKNLGEVGTSAGP
jgi:LPS-assembly protein